MRWCSVFGVRLSSARACRGSWEPHLEFRMLGTFSNPIRDRASTLLNRITTPQTQPVTMSSSQSRSGGERMIHQDYIARIRYSNALPPPPNPPKLLDIPNTGLVSGQYTTPGFASRLAREQPLNIEADAELGMPLDLVGMPGVFDGDESGQCNLSLVGPRRSSGQPLTDTQPFKHPLTRRPSIPMTAFSSGLSPRSVSPRSATPPFPSSDEPSTSPPCRRYNPSRDLRTTASSSPRQAMP
jgi:hypothetical protein